MQQTKSWYAVYTRPRWEKKTAAQLTDRRIECYCPVRKIQKQWADRKKMVLEPLFTSYVFVHVTPNEHLSIIQLDGVINFVYWLGKPAVIKEEEITAIKSFLSQYEEAKIEKTEISIHDRIRVTSGPLIHEEGDVLKVGHKTVKLYLPTLGYQLIVEIEKKSIEVIGHSKPDQSAYVIKRT